MQFFHQANQLKEIAIIIHNISKLVIRMNKEEKKVVKIEKK